jgi:hypothetical protein
MMNRWFELTGIVMIFLFSSCAISKKENERMVETLREPAVLPEIVGVGTPDSVMLASYENRAMQKLEDFYDYANLLMREDYSDELKGEIRASANSLFSDPAALARPFEGADSYPRPLSSCLSGLQADGSKKNFSPKAIKLLDPLVQISDNRYDGRLLFLLEVQKNGDLRILNKTVRISLQKIKKSTGSRSYVLWEVYLGQIG